jgi:hypothetical protein
VLPRRTLPQKKYIKIVQMFLFSVRVVPFLLNLINFKANAEIEPQCVQNYIFSFLTKGKSSFFLEGRDAIYYKKEHTNNFHIFYRAFFFNCQRFMYSKLTYFS